MKASTFKTRLDKIVTSKNRKAYQILNDIANQTNKSYMIVGGIIRPCHTSGSGRFTSNLDYTKEVETLLSKMSIKFESGNDSPRGGKTGNWIKILTKIER